MEVGDEPAAEKCPEGHPLGIIHESEAHVAHGPGDAIAWQHVFCEKCNKRYQRDSASDPWVMRAL